MFEPRVYISSTPPVKRERYARRGCGRDKTTKAEWKVKNQLHRPTPRKAEGKARQPPLYPQPPANPPQMRPSTTKRRVAGQASPTPSMKLPRALVTTSYPRLQVKKNTSVRARICSLAPLWARWFVFGVGLAFRVGRLQVARERQFVYSALRRVGKAQSAIPRIKWLEKRLRLVG